MDSLCVKDIKPLCHITIFPHLRYICHVLYNINSQLSLYFFFYILYKEKGHPHSDSLFNYIFSSDVKYGLNPANLTRLHPTPNIYVLSSPISPKQLDKTLLQISALCCPTPDTYIAISHFFLIK